MFKRLMLLTLVYGTLQTDAWFKHQAIQTVIPPSHDNKTLKKVAGITSGILAGGILAKLAYNLVADRRTNEEVIEYVKGHIANLSEEYKEAICPLTYSITSSFVLLSATKL